MKKRRGKQPVKPDLEEALKERLVYLKGAQGSTMNIPIIYRRTFGWESESVIFRPINKRAFVVYRSDLDKEEMDPSNFIRRELDVKDLPWYPGGRKDASGKDRSKIEELKEALVSHSLSDRYVHVDLPKPDDKDLDKCLREDLELLSGELGYSYSTIPDAYRCTFIYPRHNNQQMVTRSISVLRSTLKVLRSFIGDLLDLSMEGAWERLEELRYSVQMAEVNIDRVYTDALNVHWDLPQVEPAGFFILSQVCERAHDEIEYLVDSTLEVKELLSCAEADDVKELLYEEVISIWRSSVGRSIDRLEQAMDIYSLEDEVETVSRCLGLIREHRMEKQNRSSMQDHSVTELATKIESLSTRNTKKGGLKLFARKECIGTIELLFAMNQAAARIGNLTKIFTTKILYIINSRQI
jgi:hypothetical protein